MTVLYRQLVEKLRPGMYVPEPFKLLFAWIEENNFFIEIQDSKVGLLFPYGDLQLQLLEPQRSGGTYIELFAEGNVGLERWFGHEKIEVLDRGCVFAKTGSDGSKAAFWLDDDGRQKIVHLGSESGSTLVCVLADDPVDFLRLLAIGYSEICWPEAFSMPPMMKQNAAELVIFPNVKYQAWVKKTFSVSIPSTASEIVKYPSQMGDVQSEDPFY